MQRKKKKGNKIKRLLFFYFSKENDFNFFVNRSYFSGHKKAIIKPGKII